MNVGDEINRFMIREQDARYSKSLDTSKFIFDIYIELHANTVEPLLKDTPNKGHNTFDLSIKDKICGPYRTMAIQFYL